MTCCRKMCTLAYQNQQMALALELIRQTTPFPDDVVVKWLVAHRGINCFGTPLDCVSETHLWDFLYHGLHASRSSLEAAATALRTRQTLSTSADAWGFTDPRAFAKIRLAFDLPFSLEAFHDPLSPFFGIGHRHKDYVGWWPCQCWKCT